MSYLPARLDDDGSFLPRQVEKARRMQASTELEVFRHALQARALADIDQLDTQAIADATRAALDEEVELFDYGMSRVGQSSAKAALIARHVERLATINDRRITRRFGG